MSIEQDAYRYAIKNAALHSGKADVGAVVGKLKALHPEINVKKTLEIAIEAVKKVNVMEEEEIKKSYSEFDKQGYDLKPKEKETFEGKEYPVYRVPISSSSHPFFTGNKQFVDAEGNLERFVNKYKKKRQDTIKAQEKQKKSLEKKAVKPKRAAKKKKNEE